MHCWPHPLCNFEKKLLKPIQNSEDDHFWVQNGRFTPNKHFLGKIINIIFIYLLIHFTAPNLKKNLK